FISAFALLYSFSLVHEFYISITSLDYNQESQKLEISCQFTAHDMEQAILTLHDIDLNLGEPNEHEKADSYLYSYIVSNLKLTASSEIKYSYIGKEVSLDETLWIYIESSKLDKPTELQVENTFLIDEFESQANITHVNFGTRQQTFSFNRLNKINTYTIK
ncbi:MAG: DUF6702 family protein, partial [Flavobacteriales bacterium]